MYIKSMTIDGFKSYGQRTIITGFDPYFNAITGLNGSGKSNILDAICFLLGISNLSQVRAANFQELVYKNGQAGITKATVSVTFDNKDRGQSPFGYEQYDEITVTRQIIIGGHNKYLINGCAATNTRVKDLFQSIQMNVNNPHFLIMQGRITKVLNMKPIEILSMLEEAAGTKMYEEKRLVSHRTMGLKDSKLREIDSVLAEEITPTLTKLKEERAAYLEYQKIQRELEHLTKLYIAYQYVSTQELNGKLKEKLACTHEKIKNDHENVAGLQEKSKEMEGVLVEKIKENTAETKGKLMDVENILKEKEITVTKMNSKMKNTNERFKVEQKKIIDFQKQKTEDVQVMQSKGEGLEMLANELEKLKENQQKDYEALLLAENQFKAVSAGLSNNEDGVAATLADQLMTEQTKIATAETGHKQAEMTLKHSRSELAKKESDLKTTAKEYEKDRAELGPLQQEIARIENEIKKLGYEEGKYERLVNQKRDIEREANSLNERYDSCVSRVPNLAFDYKDPVPNFDRRKVKGVLCDLFTMKDPRMAMALEVIAGGKLFNVVVDNEETGKLLLMKGGITRRRTLLPLNKIQGYPIQDHVLRRAEQLVGKENVCSALSYIEYEPYLRPAMEYAFGNTLICTDARFAQKVAFDPQIRKRTVTLDGDVYDPAGTLTGGSKAPGDPLLIKVQEIRKMETALKEMRSELANIEAMIASTGKTFGRYNELRQRLDIKHKEAQLVNDRLKHTTHHQKLEEIKCLQATIEEQETALNECTESITKAQKKIKDLEYKIKNSKNVHEEELKIAEKNLNQCRLKAEASAKLMKEKEQEAEVQRMEADEMAKGILNYDEQIEAVKKAVAGIQAEIDDLTKELSTAMSERDQAEQAVNEQKEFLRESNREIHGLQARLETMNKEVAETAIRIKESQIEASKLENSIQDSANKLKDLVANHGWIREEERFFGQPNTSYDFQVHDPKEGKKRLHKLQEKKEELSKNVNMRAMITLDSTEEQYSELLKKKEIVEHDKLTIAAVIKELDEKKKEVLQTAWVKVNEDFGSIFSSLLPGSQAKLEPADGRNVLSGLSVKVAFGNIWKDSLSELSGGQKSLVALSLILSLLLFKPAPIYILDEVDAALDLSHTQNIGSILKNHFKSSQFIVVSLKDGMFNNANVLFRTKFVDGMSTVTRHTRSS